MFNKNNEIEYLWLKIENLQRILNIRKSKRPNLFIPGAGKSGTSTLHELLQTHPDICMSSLKEPHFWTWPHFDTFLEQEFEEYAALFTEDECEYFGESSTGYMCFPNFIERIQKHYTTTPKFIFILRNPIDRAYSHYWWLRGTGSEDLSFREAFLNDFDIEPSEDHRLPEAHFKHYHQFGLYAKWLVRFYDAFGAKNIHVITTEQLKNNRIETVNSCFDFLGLEKISTIPDVESNQTQLLRFPKLYKYAKKLTWGDYKIKRMAKPFVPKFIRHALNTKMHHTVYKLTSTNKKYPPISEEDRQWLKGFYADDVAKLKELTQLRFSEWIDFTF